MVGSLLWKELVKLYFLKFAEIIAVIKRLKWTKEVGIEILILESDAIINVVQKMNSDEVDFLILAIC